MKRQLLKEGTSNFGRLDPLPLLVFYTYDEILYRMIYDSDYPNKDDYYDDEGNFDSSAYEEAIEKFEEDYFNKIDICILDDYSVDGLEDDLDDLNRTLEDKANDLEDEAWQRDNSDEGISREEYDKLMDTAASLHDIATFSIEPGHYEASYIDNKYPESYNDLTEEDKKFVMNKIKEIKKKYNLTALGVSYRFSNGETGYHKVEMEESVELDDVDESIEGTPKVGDYKKKVSKHLKSNKKGARGNNDGFGKTHNTDPEKNMKIFNHMMGSDTPSTSGGETSVGGEGSCCESVELDEKKTSKYESEHFIAQCEFKPGRYRNYYYVHLIDKKANNNCFTNEIVREYAKGSYGWINRPYEGFDYKMALLDACRKYGLSDDKIEQLRKCTDFQSTLDLFDKLEQEEVKEGTEGKRVPGKEYVIYDCSLENGKKAPIVAIRSTYTEAQWYCNKPGNFDKDLGIEEVPKGRFHKGDDFYGPFDGETWELKESKLNEVGDEERVEHYQAELDKLGATEEECNKYIKIADNYEAKAEKHFITYEQMDEVAKAMGLEQMSDNELARAWKVCYYTLDRESFKADDSEDLERWRKYSDAASAFAEVINREARKRKSSGHYSPRKGESLDVKEVIGNDFIVDPDGLLYLKGDAMERLVAEAKDRDIPFDEFIKMGFSSSDSRGRYGSLVFSEYESQFKELWAEYDELLKQAGNR